MKEDSTEKRKGQGSPEQPRGIAFHWLANMVLASLALLLGIAFGEKLPREQMGTAFVAVSAIALALVPLTRYWEKSGIEARRKAAEQAEMKAKGKAASQEEPADTRGSSRDHDPPA